MSLRAKAFLIHFAISSSVLLTLTFLMVSLWYAPGPLLKLQGGDALLIMLIAIDVILGPSLTWLVFKPDKSRRMLIFDLMVIVIVQLAAFSYGAWALYSERPLFLTFVTDRFEVVRAPDINVNQVDKPVAAQTEATGAQWVRVEIPAEMQLEQLLSRQFNSPGMELKPAYYRPFPGAHPETLAKYALPMQQINADAPVRPALENWLKAHQLSAEKVLLFPVHGRAKQAVAILASNTGVVLGIVVE